MKGLRNVNLEYVNKGSTAIVRTDDGEKMVRNNANLYEILVSENIKEQLQFYNKRDVSRLSFLERRKFKLNKANFGTAISTVAVIVIAIVQIKLQIQQTKLQKQQAKAQTNT